MKLNFLGSASKVGPLSLVIHYNDFSLIFDHGMLPADPPEYPMRAPLVDMGFLTHSHLDHCGMMPSLLRQNDIPILSTHPTVEVAELLLYDSLKIADIEGYPKHFEKIDIKNTKAAFDLVGYNSRRDIGGMEIEVHSAGHIPGSSMFELKGDENTLFTGDLNTTNTRLLWGTHPVECDNLVMEATYAGEEHDDRDETEKRFLDKIDETLEAGGQVIVPVFAVGRTQEILMLLDDRDYDVWYDGMGRTVSRIYLNHGGFLRAPKALKKAIDHANEVRSPSTRKKAKDAEVIVTTSGMLEGGPVLEYLREIRKDPNSSVLLTGYQVEGTNGRRLLDNGMIRDKGATLPVECYVEKFDFSAHAGHQDLVEFAKGCNPENIILCHGDKRDELAEDLSEFEVYTPEEGEEVEL
ncbi:MAG: MBL fold metallo-hydrolase [Candidatus Thermoplasmatota archaeon]